MLRVEDQTLTCDGLSLQIVTWKESYLIVNHTMHIFLYLLTHQMNTNRKHLTKTQSGRDR